MNAVLDILCWILLLSGSFLVLVGGLGLLRLPDFYTRIHAAGITDTLGTWLILGGLMVQSMIGGMGLVTAKLVIVLVFLVITSPTAGHALAKAAWLRGLEPWTAAKENEHDHAD